MLGFSFIFNPVLDGKGWLEMSKDALSFLHLWPSPELDWMAGRERGCFGYFSPVAMSWGDGIDGGDGGCLTLHHPWPSPEWDEMTGDDRGFFGSSSPLAQTWVRWDGWR